MPSKDRKKVPKIKHSISLRDINELSMCVFIVKRTEEEKLLSHIKKSDARLVSMTRGLGVSRSSAFESLKIGTEDVTVFFCICRDEDVGIFMKTTAEKFELDMPGNGKGFIIDINGYLGAKAAFLEG